MEKACRAAQEKKGVDAGHEKAGRGKGREQHMQRFMKGKWVQQRHQRSDIGDLSVDDVETGRRVHPGVDRDHEDGGGGPAHRHDKTGQKVGPWRDARPAIEIDSEKDRFREECKPLKPKEGPDDGACPLHE